MDIYGTIYQTVDSELKQNGLELPFSEDEYLHIVRKNPYYIDAEEYNEIVNCLGINAFYYRLSNRLPNKGEKDLLKKRKRNTDKDELQNLMYFATGVINAIGEKKKIQVDWSENKKATLVIKCCRCYFAGWIQGKTDSFVLRFKLCLARAKLCTIIRVWDMFSEESKNAIRRIIGRPVK